MTWTTRTLGEICDDTEGVIRTGPFGSQLHRSDYSAEGTPVVMPQDIVEDRVSTEKIARVSTDHVERLSQHRLTAGDIVYGRRGDIGRHALITTREEGWLCGTGCLRISLGDRVLEPSFLHYYLSNPRLIEWIYNQAVGATMPNLNTSILRSVPVSHPPLSQQRDIAGILSAYDELIENHSRRIAVLEEMAQAIYREWFVNFRFPGHEQVEMFESELGQIPKGWEIRPFAEAVEVNPAVALKRSEERPYVPMANVNEHSMLVFQEELRTSTSGSKFQNGDTLLARITPSLENGKTGYVQFLPSAKAAAIGSTEFFVLRSRTLSPELVYLLARSDHVRDPAIKSMTGASGRQRVQVQVFDRILIPQPPEQIVHRFQQAVKPMFELVWKLAESSRVLRASRDLVLPKLVSGKIGLSELPEPEVAVA